MENVDVLAIAAHPDDIELTCGGTLIRAASQGYSVGILDLTQGEMGTRGTPELRAKETQAIKDWVDVAVKLGAGHIRVFGGTVPKTSTEDDAAGWVVEVLKGAGAYAAKYGVVLGLENHGGITERAERILDILKRVDLPSVRVNLDMGNFNRDAYRQLEQIASYAANVQVKVDVRDENGKQVPADWERIIRMLKASGYRGYLSLEYEAKAPAPVEVPRLTRELNAVVKKVSAG